MNVINNYTQLDISRLQRTRLYMQGRPLSRLWRKQRRNIEFDVPSFVPLIEHQLSNHYIAVDCAGWYFANNRKCTAIELFTESQQYWPDTHVEHDYLSWCPTYLEPTTVLAYYASYFKYVTMDNMAEFVNIWCQRHTKLIIGLDPTKVKFNYLKHNFVDQLSQRCDFNSQITVLEQSAFHLLFVIEKI